MLRKPVAVLSIAAFAFALALSACGGDDSGSLTAPAASSGSSGSEAPAASSGAPDTGSAGTTAVPNFSGSGGDAFCGQAKQMDQLFGGQSFDSNDPAALQSDFDQAQSALDQLAKSAPDEIKADVKTISDALKSLIGVFESANYDFTKLAQDPAALAKLESFSSQEVTDASARVEAYLTQVCGISTTDTTGG